MNSNNGFLCSSGRSRGQKVAERSIDHHSRTVPSPPDLIDPRFPLQLFLAESSIIRLAHSMVNLALIFIQLASGRLRHPTLRNDNWKPDEWEEFNVLVFNGSQTRNAFYHCWPTTFFYSFISFVCLIFLGSKFRLRFSVSQFFDGLGRVEKNYSSSCERRADDSGRLPDVEISSSGCSLFGRVAVECRHSSASYFTF